LTPEPLRFTVFFGKFVPLGLCPFFGTRIPEITAKIQGFANVKEGFLAVFLTFFRNRLRFSPKTSIGL
jgi:hypothetical protein